MSSELSHQLDPVFYSIKENVDYEELKEFSWFHRVFPNLLNIQAPLKKKLLRGNNSPFKTKTLKKTIMIRSKLKNRFHKTRSDENWLLYKTQRNLCTNLLRKTKKDYFSKVNPKLLSGNKNFWRIIKPYFSETTKGNKIMILEKHCAVSDDRRLSEIFSGYFINITKTLEIKASIISTTTPLPENFEIFKIILVLRKFSLCKGRSFRSSFIL